MASQNEEKTKGTCGECKWWDTTTTREFHRDGIRQGLVEIRSICRSPTAKAKGHLTAKPSVRPCFERGTFVPTVKEETPQKKEGTVKEVVLAKKIRKVKTKKGAPEVVKVTNSLSGATKTLERKENGKVYVKKE